MAEIGALTGLPLLNLDEKENQGVDPIVYNVYQTQSQTPTMSNQDIQRLYGTQAFPVFEWAKKIQTGQRSYTPGDAFDEDMLEKYKKFEQLPPGFMTPQEIMAQRALEGSAGQIGQTLGANIGRGLTNPYAVGQGTLEKGFSGLMRTGQSTPLELARSTSFANLPDSSKNILQASGLTDNFVPELANRQVAEATGNLAQFERGLETGTLLPIGTSGDYVPTNDFGKARNVNFGDEATGFPEGFDATQDSAQALKPVTTVPTETSMADAFNPMTDAGQSNLYASGIGAGVNFVGRVAAGQDVDDAAVSAADAGIIQYATTALLTATPLAPFATIIGGVVGGFVGRVICNELMRQGIMDRKQVILDYKFTRDYLTPTHVAGYHVWAVWMVKQMRKGRFVGLWAHIAGHRANEIAYIYGERDKPDYLGKLYRKILEPICWTVGTFCKETDCSILYRKKEI